MFCNFKLFVFGIYLSTLTYGTHSYVLLTANVEDLKRIAQKFVSDSLADKIAKFIIEAADNKLQFDNLNVSKDLSADNDEFDVEKKDTNINIGRQLLDRLEISTRDYLPIKPDRFSIKSTPTSKTTKMNQMGYKRKKYLKSKANLNKRKQQSSLEFYRSNKQLIKSPNAIIDVRKIHDSDNESDTQMNLRNKDFDNVDYFDKLNETQAQNEVIDDKIHKYIENEGKDTKNDKKSASENYSDDSNESNKTDIKSDELKSVFANLTTAKKRTEFDQYFNTNYPKSDVIATSGLVELTKPTQKEASEVDYE